MTRLQTTGFETGHAGADGFATGAGTPSIVTSPVRSGTYALQCAASASAHTFIRYDFSALSARHYYLRAYIYFAAAPSATTSIMGFTGSGSSTAPGVTTADHLNVALDTSRRPLLRAGTTVYATGAALATGTWHRVELRAMVNTTASALDEIELYVNGAQVGAKTNQDLTSTLFGARYLGVEQSSGLTIVYDDVAFNDDQGTAQNSWPGEGNIVFLVPTADAGTRNAWLAGAGATANLFAAADNRPPAGVADASMTNASQIKNATGSNPATGGAAEDYHATLTTYSAAGIGASDTVTVVQAICVHGENVGTGTKTGALKIVSNPAQGSESTFTYGDDAGAVAAFPDAWRTHWSASITAPSVTLGTAPVLLVGKRTSTTRVVSVALMGVYVEYVPASGPATYTETGSATGTWRATGPAIGTFVDAGSATGVWRASGPGALLFTEAGSAAGTWTASGPGAFIGADSGTGRGVWTGSATDAGTFADSGAPVGAWRASGTDAAIWTDAGGVAGAWNAAGPDTLTVTEAGAVVGVWRASGGDTALWTDSGYAVGVWSAAGADTFEGVAIYDETGAVVGVWRASGVDAGLLADSGVGRSVWAATGSDASTLADAGAGRVTGSAIADDALSMADAGSGAGTWTGSAADSATLADAGGGAGTWTGTGADTGVFADTGTARGVWSATGADSVTFIDAGAGRAVWSGSATDPGVFVETGAGRGVWVASGLDAALWVEGGAVVGVWTASGLDTGAAGSVIYNETGAVVGVWSASLADALTMTTTGAGAGPWRATGTDAATAAEAGGATGTWGATGGAALVFVEAGAIAGTWTVTGPDTLAMTEAGAGRCQQSGQSYPGSPRGACQWRAFVGDVTTETPGRGEACSASLRQLIGRADGGRKV